MRVRSCTAFLVRSSVIASSCGGGHFGRLRRGDRLDGLARVGAELAAIKPAVVAFPLCQWSQGIAQKAQLCIFSAPCPAENVRDPVRFRSPGRLFRGATSELARWRNRDLSLLYKVTVIRLKGRQPNHERCDGRSVMIGRSAAGVRMSRGTSKSRAAPRICSGDLGKPVRR